MKKDQLNQMSKENLVNRILWLQNILDVAKDGLNEWIDWQGREVQSLKAVHPNGSRTNGQQSTIDAALLRSLEITKVLDRM